MTFYSPKLNCSVHDGISLCLKTHTEPILEGVYKIAGYQVDVIHTPGHTIGSCMFYFQEKNVLFSGDTIMREVIALPEKPTGSYKDLKKSIQKFGSLSVPDDLQIYCGHGLDTTYSEIMQMNPYIAAVTK